MARFHRETKKKNRFEGALQTNRQTERHSQRQKNSRLLAGAESIYIYIFTASVASHVALYKSYYHYYTLCCHIMSSWWRVKTSQSQYQSNLRFLWRCSWSALSTVGGRVSVWWRRRRRIIHQRTTCLHVLHMYRYTGGLSRYNIHVATQVQYMWDTCKLV